MSSRTRGVAVAAGARVELGDAVFDQRVLGTWRPFVIDSDRSAPIGNRSIVQNRDAFGRNLLPHEPRKRAGSFAVKVAFQPMANRFVQQNARPAGSEDDIHDTSRCRFCIEVYQCNAQSFAGNRLPVVAPDQTNKSRASAAAKHAAFTFSVFFDNHTNVQPGHGTRICHKRAFWPQDQHLLVGCGQSC